MRPRRDRSWPDGLEALRPDDLARRRMRRAIRAGATGLLRARRRQAWQEVAAGWATILAPLAALLAVAFAGLAYRAAAPATATATTAPSTPVTVEELAGPGEGGEPFGYLTGTDEPSTDRVLTAVILYEDP